MKKLLILIISAIFVLSLASCGIINNFKSNDSAHTHEFGEWTVTKEATCVFDGERVSSCSCGEKRTEVIEFPGHNYVSAIIEPTCMSDGYTTYTCTYCADSYVGDKVERLGHFLEDDICIICGIACSQGLEYKLDYSGTGYIVAGMGTCEDTEIIIPRIYNGLIVTEIGEAAFATYDKIVSVQIPDGVTAIGYDAFYHCTNLTSVVIPDSVTEIGWDAFGMCENLTSVVIPDSVTEIGYDAFFRCENLTSVVIPNSVTKIGECAFAGCDSITSITVDDNNEYYKSIDGNLYTKDGKTLIQYAICKTDSEFVIPDGVTKIGYAAFYKCTSLTSVVIPDSVTEIGDDAFYNCTSLISVVIPDSVTIVGKFAFEGCESLVFTEYDNAYYLGNLGNPYLILVRGKDESESIKSYTINEHTKIICPYAFILSTSLTSITIPDSVTVIGDSAFRECYSLKSVVIGKSVSVIGYDAFASCTSLTSVVIPNSVTEIGADAFSRCENLTIYCEAESKPEGWHEFWDHDICTVLWRNDWN